MRGIMRGKLGTGRDFNGHSGLRDSRFSVFSLELHIGFPIITSFLYFHPLFKLSLYSNIVVKCCRRVISRTIANFQFIGRCRYAQNAKISCLCTGTR